MKKLFVIVCSLALMAISSVANAENLKAQGYYYEALDLVNADYITAPGADYEKVLDLALKSKEALGGTNEQLQYLLVKSYSELEDWKTAQIELVNYTLLLNETFKSVEFDNCVAKLGEKQKKELSKLAVAIESATLNSEDGVPNKAYLVFLIVLSAIVLLGGFIVLWLSTMNKRAKSGAK